MKLVEKISGYSYVYAIVIGVCVCAKFRYHKGNLSLRKVAWNFPKEMGQVYVGEILSGRWKNWRILRKKRDQF